MIEWDWRKKNWHSKCNRLYLRNLIDSHVIQNLFWRSFLYVYSHVYSLFPVLSSDVYVSFVESIFKVSRESIKIQHSRVILRCQCLNTIFISCIIQIYLNILISCIWYIIHTYLNTHILFDTYITHSHNTCICVKKRVHISCILIYISYVHIIHVYVCTKGERTIKGGVPPFLPFCIIHTSTCISKASFTHIHVFFSHM